MKKQMILKGCRRGFHFMDEAWYAPSMPKGDFTSEVMFGFYDDGTTGEMAMCWREVGGESTPQLFVFGDAFKALSLMPDLLDRLADYEDIMPQEFCGLLRELGFLDRTARTLP